MRRTVHTLKGDSAACGLPELSELAHMLGRCVLHPQIASKSALAEVAFTAADMFHVNAFRLSAATCNPRQDGEHWSTVWSSSLTPEKPAKKVNEPKNIPTAWAEAERAAGNRRCTGPEKPFPRGR